MEIITNLPVSTEETVVMSIVNTCETEVMSIQQNKNNRTIYQSVQTSEGLLGLCYCPFFQTPLAFFLLNIVYSIQFGCFDCSEYEPESACHFVSYSSIYIYIYILFLIRFCLD